MKEILVLTGSPRKRGNSDLMADSFMKGAMEAGHNVTKFKTAFKNINGCRACNSCFSKGKPVYMMTISTNLHHYWKLPI